MCTEIAVYILKIIGFKHLNYCILKEIIGFVSPFAKLSMKFILKAPITTAADRKYTCDFFLNVQTNKCY